MLTAVHKKHSVILVRHYAANGPDMRAFEIRARETHAQFEGTGVDHLCQHVGMSRRNQEPVLARGKPECWGWLRADVEGLAASGKAVIRRDHDTRQLQHPACANLILVARASFAPAATGAS